MPSEFQSWNGRSKRWVHSKAGVIQGTSKEKFPGIPVKKDKPESTPAGKEITLKKPDEKPDESPEEKPADEPDPPASEGKKNPWALL